MNKKIELEDTMIRAPLSQCQQQLAFMLAMGLPTYSMIETVPRAAFDLSENLIREEGTTEFWPAFFRYRDCQSVENLVELVDACVDTIYVIYQLMNTIGVPYDACFEEVQRSNMAKRQKDGTVRRRESDGKVLKPVEWLPPDIFAILHEHLSQLKMIDDHQKGKPIGRVNV